MSCNYAVAADFDCNYDYDEAVKSVPATTAAKLDLHLKI